MDSGNPWEHVTPDHFEMPSLPAQLCARCRVPHDGDCPERDRWRPNSRARGYTSQWEKFREAYITTVVTLDPVCQDCRCGFNRTSEIELHHVVKVSNDRSRIFDPSNIKHLCSTCHARRTARGE